MIDLGEVTWALSMTEPGAFETSLSTGHQWDFVPAHVPGTVAGALTDAGLYDPENPVPLHGKDVWYEAWFDISLFVILMAATTFLFTVLLERL